MAVFEQQRSTGGRLPEGWNSAKLPQVASINMGQSPPGSSYNEEQRGLPFFQGKADFGERYPTVRVWCTDPKKVAQAGDVLMSVRAPIGPTNVAADICSIGRGLAAISPLGGVPTDFVLYGLRLLEPELALRGTGSTFTAINKNDLHEIFFNVPPLAEQQRIVAQLERLLARVDAARERLAKLPALLKRFRQAVLAAACSGRLTEDWRVGRLQEETVASLLERISGHRAITEVRSDEDPVAPPETPDEWTWSRCEYLCDKDRAITYGVIKLGSPVPDGVPTLRSSDVRWLHIDNSRVKRIAPEIASDYGRTFLRGGEVLVTVRGTLGGVGVVPKDMEGFNISREVAMLPLHPLLNATFFAYAIGTAWSQSWLSEMKRGVAYTGINIGDLKHLPLPVPPVAEQHAIVRRVDALFRLAAAIERRAATAKAHTDKLTQAILAKAFRGELVPTEAALARREGRPYESAVELLARIQAERPASPARRPRRRAGSPRRRARQAKPLSPISK